jgi:sulfur-oxidizing protein SoxY
VARTIKTVTLVIDENPAPVAAVFHLGSGSDITRISTRVRINAYSHVRAVAEMNNGELYMVSRFVKASGGCSAPASKNHDQAVAEMGKMRLRQYGRSAAAGKNSDRAREVQLQIRHPNHSGLQMDQLTGYYIPAHFVEKIEIYQGAARLLAIKGAISLSEDPSVRFIFTPVGRENLEARVVDNDEKVFKGSWPFREAGDKNM